MKLLPYALPAFLCLLVACSGPNTVQINYSGTFCDTHKVKIDDTLILKSVSDSLYPTHSLYKGRHTLTIDGGQPVTFKIYQNGILNLAHEEFVIFPIEYTYGEKIAFATMAGFPNLLVIDSFIVGKPRTFDLYRTNMTKSAIMKKPGRPMDLELVKTDPNLLVVEQHWDYGLNEMPKKSIQEKVNKNTSGGSTFLHKVLPAKVFLLYAQVSEEYTVKSIADLPD